MTFSLSPKVTSLNVVVRGNERCFFSESAALQVTLKATSPLQLTVTRTGVELIKNAVNNFLEAVNKDMDLAEATSSAPYILQNHLGIDVKLQVCFEYS